MKPHPAGGTTVGKLVSKLRSEGIDFEVYGKSDFIIDGIADLHETQPNSLFFYTGKNQKKIAHLKNCALVCSPDLDRVDPSVTRIVTPDPKLAFIILVQDFHPPQPQAGIHPSAIVHPEARISPSATIGPYCVIDKCEIGDNTVLLSHVSIQKDTVIGSNVKIESSACIGQTGQGGLKAPNGKSWMMPQIGGTIIGDSCFIGSLVTIAKGTLSNTIIEPGCKVIHGAKVGHNANIGAGTFVSNLVVIGGSVKIGKDCVLGMGCLLRDRITIGNKTTIGMGSVVVGSFPEDGLTLIGVPAKSKVL